LAVQTVGARTDFRIYGNLRMIYVSACLPNSPREEIDQSYKSMGYIKNNAGGFTLERFDRKSVGGTTT
jgi:hypothetical protein